MFATWIRQIRQKLINRHTRNSRRNFIPGVETLEDKIVPSTMEPTYVVMHGGRRFTWQPGDASHQRLHAAPAPDSLRHQQHPRSAAAPAPGRGRPSPSSTPTTTRTSSATSIPSISNSRRPPPRGPTLYSQYGAASTFLTVYNQSGQVINPATPASRSTAPAAGRWKESLDVEWAHAIAPGAKIVLVEANSNSERTCIPPCRPAAKLVRRFGGVHELGGGGSAGESSSDSFFTTPAGHQGVTFLAATGDQSAGEYPAFSPMSSRWAAPP